jgi:hypothetical protein
MPARKVKRKRGDAGISRIHQPEKRTFGFFVRLMRQGTMYNAFFADKRYGGRTKALAAARRHYLSLVRKHGPIDRKTRPAVSIRATRATRATRSTRPVTTTARRRA